MKEISTYIDLVEKEESEEVFLRLKEDSKKIPALREKGLLEVFADEQNASSFIEDLKKPKYNELINGVKGIIRNKEPKNWVMDGEGIALRLGEGIPEYTPPAFKDRAKLFGEVLQAAQEMVKQGGEHDS